MSLLFEIGIGGISVIYLGYRLYRYLHRSPTFVRRFLLETLTQQICLFTKTYKSDSEYEHDAAQFVSIGLSPQKNYFFRCELGGKYLLVTDDKGCEDIRLLLLD